MMDRTVGVDFDNTIVGYDRLIRDEAARRGFIEQNDDGSKKEIRDRIRQLPDGEIEWQRVQASVYGPRMQEAELISGVREFFLRCRQDGIRTYIISHKTEFANFDELGVNLREAALRWMRGWGFFNPRGFGLSAEDIFFGATRLGKINHIRQLGCTDFVDDLEELFEEPEFPDRVNKILYTPYQQHSRLPGVRVACSWQEIYRIFFDDAC